MKQGILLINLGTPDSPSVKNVRKYLREFLMDERVIDLPKLQRWLLINLIIAPSRAPKSAKIYEKLWSDKGSPLLYYGESIKTQLQEKLGDNYAVELGMRYQKPSIELALNKLQKQNVTNITVLPLYPQYASSSTGSSIEEVNRIINQWQSIPSIKIIANFFELPNLINGFIKSLANNARKLMEQEEYDYFFFSYHGLPERHMKTACTNGCCKLNETCCSVYSQKNWLCYRAQCFETTRLLVSVLELKEGQYQMAFQSRLASRVKDPWLKPYADIELGLLPKKGIKKVLAFSPAFTADCLETSIEIGSEFKGVFENAGGEKLTLVPAVNDSEEFVEVLEGICAY